jgi:WD40 repeat protein
MRASSTRGMDLGRVPGDPAWPLILDKDANMLAITLALVSLAALQGSTAAPAPRVRVLEPHCGRVKDLDISSDGKRLLVGCENGHVLVYELETGALQKDLFVDASEVTDVEFDSQGERLLAAHYSCARVWNAKSFELEHTLVGQRTGMLRACFSPDGRSLATGSCGDGANLDAMTEARVWNASSGEQVALVSDLKGRVLPRFSPKGTTLLVSAEGSSDLITLELDAKATPKKLSGHSSDVAYCAWSPDGRTVLSVSSDLTGRLWNAASGKVLDVLNGHTGFLLLCEFSPSGEEASTTSWIDRTTRVWNVKTGKTRLVLEGHGERPTAAHFAPDGKTFVSADAAGIAILFELAHGDIVTKLEGHTGLISALDFSPDSKLIATASHDGTVRIWANAPAKDAPRERKR